MKRILLLAVYIVITFSFTTYSQDPNFHIYLCFGQSNMEGMGPIEAQDKTTNARVKMLQNQTCSNLNRTYGTWYTAVPPLSRCWNGLGPADHFGKTMAGGMPSSVTIGLVNTSYSGCDIAFFQKGAPLGKASIKGGGAAEIPGQFTGGYAWMLDLAKKAQTAGVIKGIIFHQGETNSNDQTWKTKVQGIVNNLRTDLGIGNVPFLAGELLYTQNGGCCGSHNTEVNKLPALITNSYVISSSGLAGMDGAHFTSASYRTFGIRYAQKMLSLVSTQCTATPIVPSVQIDGGTWQAISTVAINPGSKVVLGPQPVSGGTWSWTGCGLSGSSREQTITSSQACTATASFTNDCGTKSSLDFKITINGVKTCCGTTSSNGNPYCCTNSDPDGDGWGWENNTSCVVPGSAADVDKCGGSIITALGSQELFEEGGAYPNPFKEELHLNIKGAFNYTVCDMSGLEVETGKGIETKIVGRGLPKGVYFLTIRREDAAQTIKVLKN